MLELDGVAGGYGQAIVVDGVSLRVDPHELVTVLGPNGAGKSTLLKLIVGLVPLRRGSVRLEGEEIGALPAERVVERGVSYVPQAQNVFPSLTVRENLELMLPRRIGATERTRRLDEVMGRFGRLRERLGQRAGVLSGGERQMLALARTLVHRPRVILLDEPTAAVAPVVVAQILETIGSIRSSGIPILLVEQNARKALAVSDRGYILDGGRNALAGAADALLASPEVARLYLGAHHVASETVT